jgi:multiple sugar transport system permease protein
VLVAVWKSMGYNMILFLAGLKSIPKHLYEAASIDGATALQRFRYITLPLLTPTTFFVMVMTVIASFQVFDQVYVMTQGGPGDASRVYYYWLWQNGFRFFRMGYASAMAWVLFAILFSLTLIQMLTFGKRVQYEQG